MQFNIGALTLAALVASVSAANYTVPASSGVAIGTAGATGSAVAPPGATGSPIFTGAATNLKGLTGSSLGLVIAGGVALML
ncbi:MAG: hypothetical protein M1825_000320 [Sarcosagium campestre]|nr:MAG: hypothetical protein M1825_000320 [Sarcosagium campestre]